MDSKTHKALVGRGLPTDLIEKIGNLHHTVTNLKGFSGKVLRADYEFWWVFEGQIAFTEASA
jgi:hypothetical protein